MKKITWTKFEIEPENKGVIHFRTQDSENFSEPESEIGHHDGLSMPIGIVNTIIGPIDTFGGQSLLDHFNLWTVNTNFTLTKDVFNSLGFIDGVEIIKPLSKYKCIIGIGELFSDTVVRAEVENHLAGKHKHYLMLSKIDESIRTIAINTLTKLQKRPYWIMYILPNGEIESFETSDKSDFLSNLKKFEKYKEQSSGILLYKEI